MRILLVEDNRALAEGLATILRGTGHAVDVVQDGASAEVLAAAESFDLVILDLNLPQMDGLSVLRAMRDRQNRAAVLILTARAAPKSASAGWTLAPTTTWSSPSTWANWRRGCGPCCAGRRACAPRPSASAR
ncbi:response regulator [Frigidibacter mobilis]|uniref:response regulator n=1 Tax=Frigidibacter mobilis TaxID=1335048 RepID=UPI000A991031|nr:response regulator [Frigidibacter mobilis]